MRVVFAYRGAEPMGVAALTAYLEAHGHETRLVFDPATFAGTHGRDIPALARWFDSSPHLIAKHIIDLDPDVLAFSTITGIYKWSLEIARLIRDVKNIPTVFGGIHPTAAPQSVIDENCIDAIVLGEGEDALLELVESADGSRFNKNDIPNTWIKADGEIIKNPVRPYIGDIDTLPFPKKNDFYENMPVMSKNYRIMASRGCPNECTYCCNHIIHQLYSDCSNHVRRRSPSNVVEELERAKRLWNSEYVEFWDDVFTQNVKWIEEFAPLYRDRVGLPFQCYAHPIHFDERRAQLLAEAGCSLLKIGVQSLDDNVLKHTLNRPGRKDKVRRAIEIAHDAGIRVNVEHLLDLPGEGPDSQSRAASFYLEARPDKIANFWLVYYPGTKIGRIARDEGILTDEDLVSIDSGGDKFIYTFMFPGSKAAERINSLKPYQTFFDILPWLPKELTRWLIRRGYVNRLPHSGLLHQALMVFNALRINEREDLRAVRYTFSRKRNPFSKFRAYLQNLR